MVFLAVAGKPAGLVGVVGVVGDGVDDGGCEALIGERFGPFAERRDRNGRGEGSGSTRDL